MIESLYYFLWGDYISFRIAGISFSLPLLVLILVPTGLYFSWKTRFLPVRKFKQILGVLLEKKTGSEENSISGLQALIVSTATRVGTGNLVGVVAAISAGGAGAVFWMWVTAILGSSTAFIEATLAQIYKEKDPLYGGYRGGPSYYLHAFYAKGKKKSILAIGFAISALICFGGISQVIGNSVSSAFENAFGLNPLLCSIFLTILCAVVVLSKNGTLKVLDVLVPFMASAFMLITLVILLINITKLPAVFAKIFQEAFGFRQVVAGGLGTVIMNGIKRGLFSNEAGSGSAPCAAAAADISHPAKEGYLQALGVLIDTLLICTCTALIMLITPEEIRAGLSGMDLLQTSMNDHLGLFGVYFIAGILWLFSFSTFIGILFYARSNVAYLFGDSMFAQKAYKIFCLAMLFIGGIASYTLVWDLADIGIGLMTLFNMMALIPMHKQALDSLKDLEEQEARTAQTK
jgi:AGCS family alanine or glycine:cation symporter